MIEIDRLRLTLPAALRGRERAVARAAAQALAAGAPPARAGRLRALEGLEARVRPEASDAEIWAAIAEAIGEAAARGRGGGAW